MGVARVAAFAGAVAALAACGGPAEGANTISMRQISTSYAFTITPDEAPPHARDNILYKVEIRDRKTRQPIENGEGQIFASSREGAKTWDGFTYGPQVGTYYGKLNFVAAGDWAVAIRFRRDSLHPLERIDWMQDVLNERPSKVP